MRNVTQRLEVWDSRVSTPKEEHSDLQKMLRQPYQRFPVGASQVISNKLTPQKDKEGRPPRIAQDQHHTAINREKANRGRLC